jgi:hypothetical protein
MESRWRGLLETTAVLVAFVSYGLAWAEGLGRAVSAESIYPGQTVDDATETPGIWLLDGFNLLHAGPLGGRDRSGWWREPQRSELLALVDRFDDPTAEVWVVFDGPRDDGKVGSPAGSPTPRLTRVFAPSADEWLLARVRSAEDPARIAVVTADKQLADRARHRGAKVYSPRAFLDRCTG